jgi:hypothetical protein
MPFPPFLTAASGLGGSGPPSRGAVPSLPGLKLSLSVQKQLQSNWCWAAVATSVALFYRSTSAWTQCRVASATLGRIDCCGPAASDPLGCNQPYFLDMALITTGHFAAMQAARLTGSQVSAEVSGQRPIGCRIEWTDGSGHFLTIVGIQTMASGTTYIDVSDPIYLDARIAFQAFPSLYQSGARWTHSYLTHSSALTAAAGGAVPRGQPHYPDAIGA